MRTPVVMMSDTENDDEIHAAYLLGANSFLKKPFSCERYSDSVSLMLTYWLEMNYSSPTCRPERVVNGTFELAQRECHHTGLAWSVVLQANDL